MQVPTWKPSSAGVASEAEWGHQGKLSCPLRGASSLADMPAWDKEQLKESQDGNGDWNKGLLKKDE